MHVTFGEIVVDTDTREIARDGTPIHLSPKAFELLLILIECRPKAMSKAVLQERLWPDTFVVEKNLTNLIAEIRRALGDTAEAPRYIRTVPRFGYALQGVAAPAADDGAAATRDAGYAVHLTWDGGHAMLADGEHVLGRDPDASVCLDASSVSRHHALIRIAGARATLEDLGSKNGTAIADTRIAAATPLATGDRIRIGSVVLTCRIAGPVDSTKTESIHALPPNR
jgi:DNA-binding winged helix-turn-helix (wHTH) protein